MNKEKDKSTRKDAPAEIRSIGEIRGSTEEGIIEGYLTQWDTVDSWNTSFKRGSFKESFEKRGPKNIRMRWNHEELSGKLLECREDDFGPYVKLQCNLETDAGKKAYAHVRAGDVNCLSFGFNTKKDRWVGQVREILNIDLMECGPVEFQANDNAKITGVRSTDFDDTFSETELYQRGRKLMNALDATIMDIMWQTEPTAEAVISQCDTAIAKFHMAYIEWLNEFFARFESRSGVVPMECRNCIQEALRNVDTEALVKDTTLTSSDVETLKKGAILPLESRARLKSANEDLYKAHQAERNRLITEICNEFRSGGFSTPEKERFAALLGIEYVPEKDDVEDVIEFLKEFRNKF